MATRGTRVKSAVRLVLAAVVIVVATVFAVRFQAIRQMPPLELWHTHVPDELDVAAMDTGDWAAYLTAEDRVFRTVRTEVTERLRPDARTSLNRYHDGSVVYPARFAQDWNRSYVIEPVGAAVGAVVLLHGLTDSPYSMRHIARSYAAAGFLAVAIRLPGHGTVPAGLSKVGWEDWMAATRLAVREARRRTAATAPLHLVGYSNGGALATKFALDALEDPQLARPDRVILVSPMIGITRFARLAGIAGWPAVLPAFAQAAWLGIVPEFNPFKYNSFPVNGGRQSYRLTRALQRQIGRLADANTLDRVPPILTFQSALDFTVSTRAIVASLYAYLPANGSELVLFDVNRSLELGQLLRQSSDAALARILPSPPQAYRITVVGNDLADPERSIVRTTGAGETTPRMAPLEIRYPPEVFSMSHVSIPFPVEDPLYGLRPDTSQEDFGVQLGTLAPRGERGALVVDMDFLSRVNSNPFFPFMLERIAEGIRTPQPRGVSPMTGVSITKDPHPPSAAEIEEFLGGTAAEPAARVTGAGTVVP